jgi:histidyl-tRNA synthetase
MASAESLNQEIAQQTTLFNELRLQKAEPAAIDEAKKKLSELKKTLALLGVSAGGKDSGKKKERLLLKTGKVRPFRHHLLR